MKMVDGLHAAERIRQMDETVGIIFLTTLTQYGLEGYKYHATNYIIKPMKYARLKSEMDKFVERSQKEDTPSLVITNDTGKYKVPLKSIRYVETYNRNLMFHTEQENIICYKSMKEVERELCDKDFVRCHTSYIVNLFYVKGIKKLDIELITGRKWNYQQLREGTEDMMSRVFEIQMPQGLRQIVLFTTVQYLDGTGSFYMKINEDARPYFFDLKNNFTLLELKSVLGCSSKHAKRLYSLACQWRGTGGHTYSIGELKEMLGLKDPKGKEPEQYQNHTDFKINVLEKAKNQINKYTDIEFDYKFLK